MAVFYREESGTLIQEKSLFVALRLPALPHLTVSLVGAGGKTGAMYRLADELAAKGKRVVVTTSTHIFLPDDRNVVVTGKADEAIAAMKAGEVIVVGQMVEKQGLKSSQTEPRKPWASTAPELRKLCGLPPSELGKLSAAADILLIEADGAKRLPLKVPRTGEPVIPPETDVVVACAGLDSLGQTFEDACFRFETEGGWVRAGATKLTDVISPGDIAEILTAERGARKGVGDREYRILLNKADDKERINQALAIIEKIHNIDKICSAVSSFRI